MQRVQCEISSSDLSKHEALVSSFAAALSDTEDQYHTTLAQLLSSIKDRTLSSSQDPASVAVQVGAMVAVQVGASVAVQVGRIGIGVDELNSEGMNSKHP